MKKMLSNLNTLVQANTKDFFSEAQLLHALQSLGIVSFNGHIRRNDNY